MPVLEGFLFGLGMVIFIGPVFFTLIHSSFQFGMKAGFAVALGILASDVLIVGLCSYCLIGFFENEDHRSWMALIGSGILFYLGFKYILKPAKMINDVKDPTMLMLSSFFAKGFLVNFVNPFVFIVWIYVIAYAESNYEYQRDIILFLSSALIGILFTDSIKVILAEKIKKLLSPELFKTILLGIKLVLICFGFRLLYFFFGK